MIVRAKGGVCISLDCGGQKKNNYYFQYWMAKASAFVSPSLVSFFLWCIVLVWRQISLGFSLYRNARVELNFSFVKGRA